MLRPNSHLSLYSITVILIILLAVTVSADVPNQISYQGRLTDTSGDPIDTTVSITFRIYTLPSGILRRWTETHPDVEIVDGLFTVQLGKIVALGPSVFNGSIRYLGIQVGTGPEGTELIPIVSSAYAIRAGLADSVINGAGGPWERPDGYVRLATTSDSVTIGPTLPRAKLSVVGGVYVSDHIGIGTSSGSELLVVGKNLGNFPGNRIVIGDDETGWPTGLEIGEDADNRFWLLWNVEENYMSLGVEEFGLNNGDALNITKDKVRIGTAMTITNGKVGIGTTNPAGKLHVVGSGNNSVQLPDNAIASAEMLNEPGIAFQRVTSSFGMETTPSNLMSLGVNCPSAGYVLVQATIAVHAWLQNSGYYALTHFCISESLANCSGATIWDQTYNEHHSENTGQQKTITIQSVHQVNSPGTKVFYLTGWYAGTVGYVEIQGVNVSAVFYPTWYGTGSFPTPPGE